MTDGEMAEQELLEYAKYILLHNPISITNAHYFRGEEHYTTGGKLIEPHAISQRIWKQAFEAVGMIIKEEELLFFG